MLFPGRRLLPYRFQLLLASLQLSDSLPFADVLSQEQNKEVSDRHQVSFGNEEETVFTPAITLWGFLSQVIHKGEQRTLLPRTGTVPFGRDPRPDDACRGRVRSEGPWEVALVRASRQAGRRDHPVDAAQRPLWMDWETYEQVPETLELRLIKTQVTRPGFRPTSLQIITTLTDSNSYSCEEVAQLYSKRWHVELDIRAIKVRMGLSELRCKTPEMVHKEIWTCLLAYNLIRTCCEL